MEPCSFGRQNMMRDRGHRVYPEDIEAAFDGLPVKEYHSCGKLYLASKTLSREMLVLLLRLEQNQEFTDVLKRGDRCP